MVPTVFRIRCNPLGNGILIRHSVHSQRHCYKSVQTVTIVWCVRDHQQRNIMPKKAETKEQTNSSAYMVRSSIPKKGV